jgi:flagellar hook assembly protein FlgD
VDDYELVVSIAGGGTVTRRFQVGESAGRLAFRDLIPFPNPFDASGTHFSFLLLGAEPADVRLSVYTLSGRLILTRTERTLVPGYHQIAWDGRDAEGDELANGVYLFRMNARTAGGESITETGRLVKLRRPRRVEEPLVP